eukprot:TRINITY_DN1338_c0_g1_i1.p1 TRINITY_DN1338_c0_g1~~TRINITY_DN1338_c0_g1_i1.p1  ORF type:complete len:568 (+),score=92.26 TRINITY_DN1338_c0_g1_i1:120-1823(+)
MWGDFDVKPQIQDQILNGNSVITSRIAPNVMLNGKDFNKQFDVVQDSSNNYTHNYFLPEDASNTYYIYSIDNTPHVYGHQITSINEPVVSVETTPNRLCTVDATTFNPDVSSDSSPMSSPMLPLSISSPPGAGNNSPNKLSPKPSLNSSAPTVYCNCQKPYEIGSVMIACEGCSEWYHLDCVGLQKSDLDTLAQWSCPRCCEHSDSSSNSRKRKRTLDASSSPERSDEERPRTNKIKAHRKGQRLCRYPGCEKFLECRTYCARHQKQKQRTSKKGKVFTTLNQSGNDSKDRRQTGDGQTAGSKPASSNRQKQWREDKWKVNLTPASSSANPDSKHFAPITVSNNSPPSTTTLSPKPKPAASAINPAKSLLLPAHHLTISTPSISSSLSPSVNTNSTANSSFYSSANLFTNANLLSSPPSSSHAPSINTAVSSSVGYSAPPQHIYYNSRPLSNTVPTANYPAVFNTNPVYYTHPVEQPNYMNSYNGYYTNNYNSSHNNIGNGINLNSGMSVSHLKPTLNNYEERETKRQRTGNSLSYFSPFLFLFFSLSLYYLVFFICRLTLFALSSF